MTHRLSSAANADRIIVISQGIVAEEGTHDELMAKKGLYSEMFTCEVNLEKSMIRKSLEFLINFFF